MCNLFRICHPQASEEELRAHFSQCGDVEEARVLTRPDGRRVGCAFVQFSTLAQAAKAIKVTNGSQIKGRTVAVDWAVGKREFQATKAEEDVKEEVIEEQEVKEEELEVKEEVCYTLLEW